MTKQTSQKRLLNIARRMLFGSWDSVFYTSSTPRMTIQEWTLLGNMGFRVQCEHPHPPESKMFYMMSEFKKENIDLYNKLSKSNKEKSNDQSNFPYEKQF